MCLTKARLQCIAVKVTWNELLSLSNGDNSERCSSLRTFAHNKVAELGQAVLTQVVAVWRSFDNAWAALGRRKRSALDGLKRSRPSTEDLTIFISAFARAEFYVKDAAIRTFATSLYMAQLSSDIFITGWGRGGGRVAARLRRQWNIEL